MSNSKKMWIVVLEQDGQKPSSTYYERRAALALKVRAGLDKSRSPLARRGLGKSRGAIVQEGCIVTESLSQAELVANLAQEYGVKVILIGTCELEPFEASHEDRLAFNRIEGILSRKGRKPEPQEWTVMCREELRTFTVLASEVLLCPSCNGTSIQVWLGKPMAFLPFDGGDAVHYWLHTRFAKGIYELPIEADDGMPPHSSVEVKEGAQLASMIVQSEIAQIANSSLPLTPAFRLNLLDAAFVTRTTWPRKARDEARAQAVIGWVRDHQGDITRLPLVEPEMPDLADCVGILGEQRVLPVLKTWDQVLATNTKE